MHQQYFESLLSKFQCGFRQHCLLAMVEKMKKIRGNKEFLLRFSLTSPKLLTAYLNV